MTPTIGEVIGERTFLGVDHERKQTGKKRHIYWLLKCKCGDVSSVAKDNALRGAAKQCRKCRAKVIREANITHGMTYTREYRVWKNMIQRCTNPNNSAWRNYGGRPEKDGGPVMIEWIWIQSFEKWFAHHGPAPSKKHTLERINNRGHYVPGNTCWALQHEQDRNKRTNVILTHNGKTQCMQDWANELGIGQDVISKRLKKGMSAAEALTTPTREAEMITHEEQMMSVAEWAKKLGCNERALRKRLARMSVHDALTKPWGRWAYDLT